MMFNPYVTPIIGAEADSLAGADPFATIPFMSQDDTLTLFSPTPIHSATIHPALPGPFAKSLQPVFAGPNDFHGDTFATASIADMGTGFSGQINAVNDIDFFRIDLDPDQTVSLRFYDAPDTLSVTVYDANQAVFATLSEDVGLWVNGLQSGTFYLRVTGANQDSYEVDFGLTPFDMLDSIDTDGRLRANEPSQGFSHGPDDDDWFLLIGSEGDQFTYGIDSGDPNATPIVRFLAADGTVLATSTDMGGGRAEISFTLPNNDSHFLSVQTGTTAGTQYQIYIPVPGDDYADDATTTGDIALGETLTGEINQNGDYDWFRFTAEAGDSLVFRLTPEMGDVQPLVSIVDANGVFVAEAIITYGSGNSFFDLTVALEQAGTFYLSFTIDPPLGQESLGYSLSLAESTDLPDNITSSARLALGVTYDGDILGTGDRDWIGITLEAGVTYRISEFSHSDVTNSVAIYDANGNNVANYGRLLVGDFEAADYVFTPGQSGLFFVAVENFSVNLQGVDTTYQLFVDEIPDDYGDTEALATALSLSGLTRGVLEHDADRDVFSIELNAHDVLIVETSLQSDLSFTAPGVSHVDPFYGTMGAEQSATHYVTMGNGTGIGFDRDYRLSAEVIADEAGGNTSTTATIGVDMTLSGMIATGADQDWYAFSATAGQITTVELLGSSSLVFTLYDSDGTFQGEILGNGTLQIEFFETDTFFMAIRGTPPPGTIDSYVINTGNAVGTSAVGTIDGDWIEASVQGGTIFGLLGDDTIIGGAGDDIVTLGAGRDRFNMAEGGGTDRITDFDPRLDRLTLEIDPFTTRAQFNAMMTDTDEGVRITLADGSSVLLEGVSSSEMRRESLGFSTGTDNGSGPYWGFADIEEDAKGDASSSADPRSDKDTLFDPLLGPLAEPAGQDGIDTDQAQFPVQNDPAHSNYDDVLIDVLWVEDLFLL